MNTNPTTWAAIVSASFLLSVFMGSGPRPPGDPGMTEGEIAALRDAPE
jgi:hypothetical protein